MLTRIVATVLIVPVALVGTSAVVPSLAQAGATAPEESPEALYDQGKKAYRLSHYEEAVAKWEKSYALSGNALLLYNIGLAYKEWYGVSTDVNHLRKAKAVFQNYAREAARNPDMDPGEAEGQAKQQIDEIDVLLDKIEEEERLRAEQDGEEDGGESTGASGEPYTPTGPDPGKKLRLAGIGAMGGGGAAFLAGTVLGVVFALKGQEFASDLDGFYDQRNANDCENSTSQECNEIEAAIETTRDNGNRANLLTVISFGVIGGIGAAALITGGVLYVKGNQRTAAWRKGPVGQLRLLPTGTGVVLSGRF